MSDVISKITTLKDAINICLSCIGETPVDAPNNTSTNVVLAKQIIEEVSRDVQSKGWWFNTAASGGIAILANGNVSTSTENFNETGGPTSSGIPEEARRYISIRAARVLQSRFVGSEELLKFSFQEEQVSLAILTQAHVRNGGNSTSFNSFPADLKGMGVEEVMFLQQSAEEKLLSLRLVTELKSTDKLVAETALIADQEELVTKQALTEVKKALDVAADTQLKGKQGGLVDAQKTQALTEAVLKSQQSLTELQNTTQLQLQNIDKNFYDGVVAGTQSTYRDFASEMRMMGIQEAEFQSTPAYKKTELISDATKLRTATATETGSDTTELSEVNKVMRLIGEPPVTALNSTSLASECIRLLRDTDKELQGRGWWFNTERDVSLTPVTTTVPVTTTTVVPASISNQFILSGSTYSAYSSTGSLVSANGTYTLDSTGKYISSDGWVFEVFPTQDHYSTENVWNLYHNINGVYSGVESTAITSGQQPWQRNWTSVPVMVNARFYSTGTPTTTTVTTNTTTTVMQVPSDVLSIEADDYDVIVKHVNDVPVLYNLRTKSISDFPPILKAEVIYQRALRDTPNKYLEYLNVRVAIILTELYPQSGVDIQRLPKMEAELRAYFKDRDADDANYSVFDNYDTASRIGINRNYDIS